MPVDRPTFSETWYRVHDLRPRLRSTVEVYRQQFRGQLWHVLHDAATNQFLRLNEPAYCLVGLLDGRRTVSEAWRLAGDALGDDAPTQGEVIQILGQLYGANFIQADLPPDAEAMFKRYRERRKREIQGHFANLLFIRLPLLDPDHFLNRWVGVFGQIFSPAGAVAWLVMVVVGLYFIAGNTTELFDRANGILDPGNLPFLYVAFLVVKVFHEFGHAFACKTFGRKTGSGGEVHVMGIMMLVFTPVPYVDASSAWALRRKWHRVLVGASGMIVEIALASVAAIIWARTGPGTVHAIAYNVMFIASVSTILFNGNPLLRYDGYFILSDILEIPNLAQRSREYVYYLVKRYAWGARQVTTPVSTWSERIWLTVYAVASMGYRIFISVAILLFVADKLFLLGAVLAVAAAVWWVLVPIGKFIRYLATNNEISRVRGRAVGITVAVAVLLVVGIGLIPAPDRFRVTGVVEPVTLALVHAETDGFIQEVLPSRRQVGPDGPLLVRGTNRTVAARLEETLARLRQLETRRWLAQTREPAEAQILDRQIAALNEQKSRIEQDLAGLSLKASVTGTWVSPDAERLVNAFVKRGERLGMVASLDHMRVRAVAGQDIPVDQVFPPVQMRPEGHAEVLLSGRIDRVLPAGREELPSAALGYSAGGSVAVSGEDQRGRKVLERFFEVWIEPDPEAQGRLMSGQRVVVRLDVPRKPLILQWWRRGLQLVQRRFQILP